MKQVGIIALAAAMIAAPGSADDGTTDRIIDSVGQQDLLALTSALGHTVVEEGKGSPALIAQTPGGIKYFLVGTACDAGGASCQGILLEARFDLPAAASADRLVQAGRDHPAVTVTADFAAGTLTMARYLVLDHGVSMANIGANVNVFLSVIPEAYAAAAGTGRTD